LACRAVIEGWRYKERCQTEKEAIESAKGAEKIYKVAKDLFSLRAFAKISRPLWLRLRGFLLVRVLRGHRVPLMATVPAMFRVPPVAPHV